MRRYFSPEKPPFAADRIVSLTAVRDRGFRQNQTAGRSQHTFLLTVSGRMRYELSDTAIEADAGELVFLPRGCVHASLYLADATEVRIVQFDAVGALPDYLCAPAKIPLADAAGRLAPFFEEGGTHPFHCMAALYDLLWQTERLRGMPGQHARLAPALRRMHADCAENCQASEYAAMCGMSESGFRRLFTECTGESPIAYRNRLRLEAARTLLENGDYNVSESARAVGFENLSFFIRLYKRRFGHTPGGRV